MPKETRLPFEDAAEDGAQQNASTGINTEDMQGLKASNIFQNRPGKETAVQTAPGHESTINMRALATAAAQEAAQNAAQVVANVARALPVLQDACPAVRATLAAHAEEIGKGIVQATVLRRPNQIAASSTRFIQPSLPCLPCLPCLP